MGKVELIYEGEPYWREDPLRGMVCWPVFNRRGRWVQSYRLGSALVSDEAGRRYVLPRHLLRRNPAKTLSLLRESDGD